MTRIQTILFVSVVFIGTASLAHALSLETYDSGSEAQRNKYVASVLKQIYDQYDSKLETKREAMCMSTLQNISTSGDSTKLLDLVALEIEIARNDKSQQYQVQDIIYGVTERECKDSAQ